MIRFFFVGRQVQGIPQVLDGFEAIALGGGKVVRRELAAFEAKLEVSSLKPAIEGG